MGGLPTLLLCEWALFTFLGHVFLSGERCMLIRLLPSTGLRSLPLFISLDGLVLKCNWKICEQRSKSPIEHNLEEDSEDEHDNHDDGVRETGLSAGFVLLEEEQTNQT